MSPASGLLSSLSRLSKSKLNDGKLKLIIEMMSL